MVFPFCDIYISTFIKLVNTGTGLCNTLRIYLISAVCWTKEFERFTLENCDGHFRTSFRCNVE